MTKTIFCDLDGCLIKHQDFYTENAVLLDGVLEKMREWNKEHHNIIITTGRKESSRKITEKTLSNLGISYDQLIMGIGPYPRVLINDLKPSSNQETATAICLQRNIGISQVEI